MALYSLFPTSVLHVPEAIPPRLVADLILEMEGRTLVPNSSAPHVFHSQLLRPEDSESLSAIHGELQQYLRELGGQLLGSDLDWFITTYWFNKIEKNGAQPPHNHANSMISGVIYLSDIHEDTKTYVLRPTHSGSFIFCHVDSDPIKEQARARWFCPSCRSGDLLLFPSYLMHGVLRNMGNTRITLSFNALPRQLNAWGYRVGFHD